MKEIKKYIKRKTKIYSLEYGAGEIVGILNLYDGVQDYIEVKFDKNISLIKLYPIDYKSELRIISNTLELTVALKKLYSKLAIMNALSAPKPRYHQRIDADVNLDYLINIIVSLVGNLNLEIKDKVLLHRCVESLILEVSQVYQINESSAKGIVSDYMKAA